MRKWCAVELKPRLALVVSLLSAFFISAGPAHALLRAYTYIGRVVEKDPDNMTITMQTEYTPGAEGWQPDSNVLQGEVPNQDAIDDINVEDEVEATSLGEPGGFWITVGKIRSKTTHGGKLGSETERTITDIYGDPEYLWDIPLAAGYVISYENTPDCSACSGCNCEAAYTTVTITDAHGNTESYDLNPAESERYLDRGRPVDIAFISGEAPAFPECSDEALCPGPQAVSNFVIHITGESEDDDDDSCFIGASARAFGW